MNLFEINEGKAFQMKGATEMKTLWNTEESMGRLAMLRPTMPSRTKGKMLLERQPGLHSPRAISSARTKSWTCHKETEDAGTTFTDIEAKWHDERSLGNSGFKSAFPMKNSGF